MTDHKFGFKLLKSRKGKNPGISTGFFPIDLDNCEGLKQGELVTQLPFIPSSHRNDPDSLFPIPMQSPNAIYGATGTGRSIFTQQRALEKMHELMDNSMSNSAYMMDTESNNHMGIVDIDRSCMFQGVIYQNISAGYRVPTVMDEMKATNPVKEYYYRFLTMIKNRRMIREMSMVRCIHATIDDYIVYMERITPKSLRFPIIPNSMRYPSDNYFIHDLSFSLSKTLGVPHELLCMGADYDGWTNPWDVYMDHLYSGVKVKRLMNSLEGALTRLYKKLLSGPFEYHSMCRVIHPTIDAYLVYLYLVYSRSRMLRIKRCRISLVDGSLHMEELGYDFIPWGSIRH